MKRQILILFLILSLFLCACSSSDPIPSGETTLAATQSPSTIIETEEEPMLFIEIIVGERSFTATLYDNETAKALVSYLPMTLNMRELNGNEKYFYLDASLPSDPHRPDEIRAGDLMLFGSDCLVLFYESFSTAYTYTPIGHIDDINGLKQALGRENIQVTFQFQS